MLLALPTSRDAPFYKTLYFKLALVFVLVAAAMGGAQMIIIVRAVHTLVSAMEQQVDWELASEMAFHLQPMLDETSDPASVNKILTNASLLNRKHDIYIVDPDGRILSDVRFNFGNYSRTISTAPIERALRTEAPDFPLLGENPTRDVSRRFHNIFSVAPIRYQGKPAYLYVILNSNLYEGLFRTSGQFYLLGVLLKSLLATTLAALILGLLLFRYLTKHLRTVSRAVRNYKFGDFSTRVPVEASNEISELAESVNEMAATIERNNRLRKQLFAGISHDLRGPLTSMQGFIEALLDDDVQIDPKERRRFLQIVHMNLRSQGRLIDDLFELAKLESGEGEPRRDSFCLAELAQDTLLRFETVAREKEVSLEFSPPKESLYVEADPGMIERVIANLLSNAVRYTSAGGRVTLRAAGTADHASVTVADTGIGIPKEHLPYIFESFYRVDADRSKATGGTGLGLSIVKRILELHQTAISVESEPGKGTAFTFSLPRSRGEPPSQGMQRPSGS